MSIYRGQEASSMAGISAVVQFNEGQKGRHRAMELAGIPRGHHTQMGGQQKDRKRLYNAKRVSCEIQKRLRVAQRQAKLVRDQETLQREGGPSYSKGASMKTHCVRPKNKKQRIFLMNISILLLGMLKNPV